MTYSLALGFSPQEDPWRTVQDVIVQALSRSFQFTWDPSRIVFSEKTHGRIYLTCLRQDDAFDVQLQRV